MTSELLTQPDAAAFLTLSERQLQRLAETGQGPRRVQLSERRVAYRRDDLVAWVDSRTSTAKHAA